MFEQPSITGRCGSLKLVVKGRVSIYPSLYPSHAAHEKKENPMRTLTKILQALLGLAFLGAGGQKLAGTDQMVNDFDRYGYPQWFRIVTGSV